MMRLNTQLAVLGLLALAGCASALNTSAPGLAVSADSQKTASASVNPKYCPTGSRVCTKEQQVDPALQGMSNDALFDSRVGHTTGGLILP